MESWELPAAALVEWARGPEPYKAVNVHGEPFSGKSTVVPVCITNALTDDESGVFLYGTGSLTETCRIAEMAGEYKTALGLGMRVAVLKDPNELASQIGSPGKVLLVMTHEVMRVVLSTYAPSTSTAVFVDQDLDASVEYVMSLTSALSHTDNLSIASVDQDNYAELKFRLVIISEEPLSGWQEGLVHHFTALRKDVPHVPGDDGRAFHPTKLDKVQGPAASGPGHEEDTHYASHDGRIEFINHTMLSGGKANLLWVGHIRTAARIVREFAALLCYTVSSATDPEDFKKTYETRDTDRNVVVIVDSNIRLSREWLQAHGITHVLCAGTDRRGNVVADTLMRTLVEDRSSHGILTDWQARRMRRLSTLVGIPLEDTHIEQPTGHDPQGRGRLLFCQRDLAAFLFRMVEHTESRGLRWIAHIWFQRPSIGLLDNCLVDEMMARLRGGGIVEERGDGYRHLAVVASDRAKAFGELLPEVGNNFGAARILAGIDSRHASAGDNLKTILVSLAVILAFQLEKPLELTPLALDMDTNALDVAFCSTSPIDPDDSVGRVFAGLLWTTLLMWQCYEKAEVLPPNEFVAGDVYVFEQMTQLRGRLTKKLGMATRLLGPITAEDRTVILQELLLATMDRVLWIDVAEGSHWPGTPSRGTGHGIRIYDLVSQKEVQPGPCCQLLDVRSLINSAYYKLGLWAVSSQPLIKTGDNYSVEDVTFIPTDTIYKWSTHKVDRDHDDVERPNRFNIQWIASLFV